MLLTILKSKIHRAIVTDSHIDYDGSITIDEEIMRAAKILPYEKVLVANLANGERFETYAIKGPKGSKTFCLNGATAHLGQKGDPVIILTFVHLTEQQYKKFKPTVVRMDKNNNIV
ncbi:MAG TPA: aspartate 1-decarboxylase [bacterium]|nr:aspartate 1-decarboxylase [bacterium]